jgi:hypothetical protein
LAPDLWNFFKTFIWACSPTWNTGRGSLRGNGLERKSANAALSLPNAATTTYLLPKAVAKR